MGEVDGVVVWPEHVPNRGLHPLDGRQYWSDEPHHPYCEQQLPSSLPAQVYFLDPPQVPSLLILEVEEGVAEAEVRRELIELDTFLLKVVDGLIEEVVRLVDDFVADLDVLGLTEDVVSLVEALVDAIEVLERDKDETLVDDAVTEFEDVEDLDGMAVEDNSEAVEDERDEVDGEETTEDVDDIAWVDVDGIVEL